MGGRWLEVSPALGPYPFLGLCLPQAISQSGPGLPPWTVWAVPTMSDTRAVPGPQHGADQLEFLGLNPQDLPRTPWCL